MTPVPRSLGLMAVATAALTAPAYAHPSHGFRVSGSLHSLLHSLDAAGYLLVALALVVVTALTIKASLRRSGGQQA